MVVCDGADDKAEWLLNLEEGFGMVFSASSQMWCLDGGNRDDPVPQITVREVRLRFYLTASTQWGKSVYLTSFQCNAADPNRVWWYGGPDDQHLAVVDQERCLDLAGKSILRTVGRSYVLYILTRPQTAALRTVDDCRLGL